MVRRRVIAGNWKMHKMASEVSSFFTALEQDVSGAEADVYVAAPFTALSVAVAVSSRVKVGAQNMHSAESGAFTGEVSASMLKDVGVQFVILGHSERRHVFGESSEFVQQKLQTALAAGLEPIVCVGETLEQRQAGQAFEVLSKQLRESLGDITAEQLGSLIVAYEPVWAIGTGETATPEQAQEVHAFLRHEVGEKWGASAAQKLVIQYGGSAKPSNAKALLEQADIDGLLVGGASLDPSSFAQIVNCEVTVG